MLEFKKFDKIPRLSRDIVITEKIDGTNGQILIINRQDLSDAIKDTKEYEEFIDKYLLYFNPDNPHVPCNEVLMVFAGSRKRWLDCSSDGDNYGFAKWVKANALELLKLGEGRHYGEWWGKGIQRGYGLDEKRFSLFNVGKWVDAKNIIPIEVESKLEYAPKCCSVVPILYNGMFYTTDIETVLVELEVNGSKAAPGFMKPEGIIIYHTASGKMFKKTIENDEKPKGN